MNPMKKAALYFKRRRIPGAGGKPPHFFLCPEGACRGSGLCLLAVRDELLLLPDVLFYVQKEKHEEQDPVGEDFKAQEDEGSDLLMAEHAAVVRRSYE